MEKKNTSVEKKNKNKNKKLMKKYFLGFLLQPNMCFFYRENKNQKTKNVENQSFMAGSASEFLKF